MYFLKAHRGAVVFEQNFKTFIEANTKAKELAAMGFAAEIVPRARAS